MEFPDYGMFFMDASIRLLSHKMKKIIKVAKQSGGVAANRRSNWSPYSITFPTTLEYLVSGDYCQ